MFYFTSVVVDPPVRLFMGEDKYENEDLIKWGWPEDVWFHVDNFSSAHVYLRMNPGQTILDIPKAVIEDAAQLCKANSVKGNKINNLEIVYTLWSNLRKAPSMDVGQVGFRNDKEVYKIHVEKRINEIVNRLNKTKIEAHPNFRDEREDRDRQERNIEKKKMKEKQLKEKEELERKRKEDGLRSYDSLFAPDSMKTNRDAADEDSDDFIMTSLVQYVVVRTDLLTTLAWPVGAVIAQACHASCAVTHSFYKDPNMVKYLEDLNNMRKVVLGIESSEEIFKLAENLKSNSVDHKLWIEQPENIATCLVSKPYPKEEIQKYFKAFKLFKYDALK